MIFRKIITSKNQFFYSLHNISHKLYLSPLCLDSVIKIPSSAAVKALPVEPMLDTVFSSKATGGSKRA